jgi:tetratricopeptide (TPR) repeat protein
MRALGAIPEHLAQDAGVLLGWPVAILCLLGLVLLISERRLRPFGPLWIPGAALFILLVPVFYSPRYSLPLAPFYLTLAAVAIASPQYALAAGRAGVPLKWLIALLPVALTLQSNVALQRQLESQTPVEVIEAGRALRDAAQPGAKVVSRKGHIGYYSGLEVAPFPRFAKLSDLAESCRRNHAEFLYFSWLEVQLRPDFSYLLDTTSAVPGLSVVHSTDQQASVVYRIGPDFGRDPAWLTDPLLARMHWERVLVRMLPDPLTTPHRNLLAAFALDRGLPAEALEEADRATRAQPSDTLGWTLKGQALRELGRPEEARQAFEAALALDPNEVQSRIGLGWVQLTLGRPEDAARAWRPVIGAARDTTTLRAMQVLFEKLGDPEAARAAGARR